MNWNEFIIIDNEWELLDVYEYRKEWYSCPQWENPVEYKFSHWLKDYRKWYKYLCFHKYEWVEFVILQLWREIPIWYTRTDILDFLTK